LSSLFTVRERPVLELVSVILTLATTAPVLSRTVPDSVAVGVWPSRLAATAVSSIVKKSLRTVPDVPLPPAIGFVLLVTWSVIRVFTESRAWRSVSHGQQRASSANGRRLCRTRQQTPGSGPKSATKTAFASMPFNRVNLSVGR
jgi:hypothetical protein